MISKLENEDMNKSLPPSDDEEAFEIEAASSNGIKISNNINKYDIDNFID